jgi:hypothetical protein
VRVFPAVAKRVARSLRDIAFVDADKAVCFGRRALRAVHPGRSGKSCSFPEMVESQKGLSFQSVSLAGARWRDASFPYLAM